MNYNLDTCVWKNDKKKRMKLSPLIELNKWLNITEEHCTCHKQFIAPNTKKKSKLTQTAPKKRQKLFKQLNIRIFINEKKLWSHWLKQWPADNKNLFKPVKSEW